MTTVVQLVYKSVCV